MIYGIVKSVLISIIDLFFSLPFINIKLNKTAKDVVSLYKNEGFISLFAKIRFWDAPLIAIEKAIPKEGKIVDIGSGEGMLTNYIALKSKKRNVIGFELEDDRVKFADRGVENASFVVGDATKDKLPKADVYLISNALHHFPSYADQEWTIRQCANNLKKRGKIIIADVDKDYSIKYYTAWIIDAFVVPILFEGSFINLRFFHRSAYDWKKLLENHGLTSKSKRIGNGPFPDVLVVGTKK